MTISRHQLAWVLAARYHTVVTCSFSSGEEIPGCLRSKPTPVGRALCRKPFSCATERFYRRPGA
jgi:hypothetical protein